MLSSDFGDWISTAPSTLLLFAEATQQKTALTARLPVPAEQKLKAVPTSSNLDVDLSALKDALGVSSDAFVNRHTLSDIVVWQASPHRLKRHPSHHL